MPAGCERGAQGFDHEGLQPRGAGRQALQHDGGGVHVGDDAGEKIALAVDQPVRIGFGRQDAAAQIECVRDPLPNELCIDGLVCARQQTNRNGAARVDVTAPEELAARAPDHHRLPRLQSRIEIGNRAGEDPRMPQKHGSFFLRLEANDGLGHVVLHSTPGRR